MPNTLALAGGILKILNLSIASLFSKQRVSVSCSYQRQILQIWSGLGGCRILTAICGQFAAVSH